MFERIIYNDRPSQLCSTRAKNAAQQNRPNNRNGNARLENSKIHILGRWVLFSVLAEKSWLQLFREFKGESRNKEVREDSGRTSLDSGSIYYCPSDLPFV